MAVDLEAVWDYLGTDHSFIDPEITLALDAERVAQSRVCRTDTSSADLDAALCRRVARHLQMKSKPLGYEANPDGGLSYISGHDSEIKRLEAPYRRMAIR